VPSPVTVTPFPPVPGPIAGAGCWCWPARSDLGERWPSPLVATAAEDRLSYRAQSVHVLDGLLDEVRPGRPRTIDDDQVAAAIERTLRTTPVDATHWSIRAMAAGPKSQALQMDQICRPNPRVAGRTGHTGPAAPQRRAPHQGAAILPPLGSRVRRQYLRSAICATRSKGPPSRGRIRTTPDHLFHWHRCQWQGRAGFRAQAVRALELTGPLRRYGSAHVGPGLAMDTNRPD
jgi:hypothetical protein